MQRYTVTLPNLLENTKPVVHKQLFEFIDNIRTPKTSYTIYQVWWYYYLSFAAKSDPINVRSSITEEEHAKHIAALEKSVPDLLDGQKRYLEQLVKKYGVETVLFAIDEYSECDVDIPELEKLSNYINAGAAALAAYQRRKEMGV